MNRTKATASICALICFLLAAFIQKNFKVPGTELQCDTAQTDVPNETNWLRDWNNYIEMKRILNASGFGEVGRPAYIEDYRKQLYEKYGYDALLSNHISLERLVPDVRPHACQNLTYLAQLPKAAIIIIFHNELLSVLLRTVHSIINRSPPELITEIVLVDDASTWADMHEPLKNYLENNLPQKTSKVRLLRRPTRGGIMSARMTGARNVTAEIEVLIFLDSHFEVGYNWLPPLLEPIALDSKVCTCPIIDRIAFDTFAYTSNMPWRGYFDYGLQYHMRPLNEEEYKKPNQNYKNYIMMGGAIAISTKFFWDLGGFDEGMTQWGGEQFELSFKLWMCGGKLIDVPCSRMGHLFRDTETNGNRNMYGDYSFVLRNYRRFLDVWVDDENRKYFFQRRSDLIDIDPGDVSERIAIREHLKCKSFNWMLNYVMPDLNEIFPPVEPHDLANGLIRNSFDKTFCMALSEEKRVTLARCPNQTAIIEENKRWRYTWRGEIRVFDGICLEPNISSMDVRSWSCHLVGGNQKWVYDRDTEWIMKEDSNLCIFPNIDQQSVQLAKCEVENTKLKWNFSYINQTEMNRWDEVLRKK